MKHFKILNTVRYQCSEFILVLAVNRLQQFNILVELLLKRINEKKKKSTVQRMKCTRSSDNKQITT